MKPIFDIFSKTRRQEKKEKREEKQSENQKIIADYREKNSLVISELISLGIEIEFRELKIGDYIVKDVIIERKTISDFISSMINKRLIFQLENMQQFDKKLLIIEGIDEQELYSNEKFIEGGMHPNSIRGFLLSILLKYKVPIIFTKNSDDSAVFLSLIARKKSIELSLKNKRKPLSKKHQLQLIIEGFPSIGPKSAKKLLKEFKTIKNIINAPEEELKKVLGKKAGIIKELVEKEY
ncbi:MAG: ERCC4 domain-containing protein [Nanoarchaeota archaeon]